RAVVENMRIAVYQLADLEVVLRAELAAGLRRCVDGGFPAGRPAVLRRGAPRRDREKQCSARYDADAGSGSSHGFPPRVVNLHCPPQLRRRQWRSAQAPSVSISAVTGGSNPA